MPLRLQIQQKQQHNVPRCDSTHQYLKKKAVAAFLVIVSQHSPYARNVFLQGRNGDFLKFRVLSC